MKTLKLMDLLRNSHGFSLTEVMVGGGILAGVALASAQMFKDQNIAQKKLTDEQKLTIFHQGLVKQMGTTSICNATMKAGGLVGQSLASGKTLDRVAKCVGSCNETGSDLDHRAGDVQISSTENIVEVGSDKFVDNSNVWSIESIRYAGASKTKSGPAIFKVTYLKDSRLTQGAAKKVTKDLVVNLRFEGDQFQECLSAQEASVNNLQNDFCKTLNYGDINSVGAGTSGQMARWNELTQQCEIWADKDCSNLGLAVEGIDSNGEVNCKSIVTPFSPSLVQQPSSVSTQSCSGTQKAVVQVHASGELKIVCQ